MSNCMINLDWSGVNGRSVTNAWYETIGRSAIIASSLEAFIQYYQGFLSSLWVIRSLSFNCVGRTTKALHNTIKLLQLVTRMADFFWKERSLYEVTFCRLLMCQGRTRWRTRGRTRRRTWFNVEMKGISFPLSFSCVSLSLTLVCVSFW